MTVYFIGAGPGASDLITVRGQQLIERCRVCRYAGSLVPAEIVASAPPGAAVLDSAPMTLDQIIAHIVDADAKGFDVARVHSGDPSIYGAIGEQMRHLVAHDLAYDVVPGVPAFTAAVYSFASIMITAFFFQETHPPEKRGGARPARFSLAVIRRYLLQPALGILLILMFAQQLIFFGYESLLGLFTLTRLGFLARGNATLFLLIGIILVLVQLRFIGRWSRRLGDARLASLALGLLALGLLLTAATPASPHPFYVREMAERDLLGAGDSRTEALIGDLGVELPPNANRGPQGVAWMFIAVVPIAIGAGLIRPALNSLITQRVTAQEYGSVLGVSAALVSGANAIAPLLAGLLFQQAGPNSPFLLGGILLAGLCALSLLVLPSGRLRS